MKQTNKKSRFLIIYLIACMLTMYGFLPTTVKAASLVNVKDTISTSAKGAQATHVFSFMASSSALVAGDKIVVTFPGAFTIGTPTISHSMNMDAGAWAGPVLTFNVNGAGIPVNTAINFTIGGTGITNPNPVIADGTAQTYQINVETQTVGDVVKERADAMVAIISNVTMSAQVEATLSFSIAGLNNGVTVNGVTTSATTTATTTPFGTLVVDATSTVAQELKVATNAKDGYVVTVQQNQELTSNHGANINSFDNSLDGTGSSTLPHSWVNPLSVLDSYHTYGHMGLTTNDADLAMDFTNSKFAGLSGTSTLAVMSHNGPADFATQNKGLARVAYSVKVGALQEAGDYQNTLTYVCTPTY